MYVHNASNTLLEALQSNTLLEALQSNTLLQALQSNTQLEALQSNTQLEALQSNTQFEALQSNTQLQAVKLPYMNFIFPHNCTTRGLPSLPSSLHVVNTTFIYHTNILTNLFSCKITLNEVELF